MNVVKANRHLAYARTSLEEAIKDVWEIGNIKHPKALSRALKLIKQAEKHLCAAKRQLGERSTASTKRVSAKDVLK